MPLKLNSSTRRYIDSSAAAQAAHESYNVTETDTPGFADLRGIARAARQNLLEALGKLERENADIAKTYNSETAAAKIAENNRVYSEYQRRTVDLLTGRLDLVKTAKAAALDRYTVAAPSAEQIALLQALSLRGGKCSDTELNSFIRACSDNYQATQTLREIIAPAGKSFALAFDPEAYAAALDSVTERTRAALQAVGTPDNEVTYSTAEFYSDTPGGYFTGAYAGLDTDIALNDPKAPETLFSKIMRVQQKAEAAGDLGTQIRVKDLLADNPDILTDEERREVNAAIAEDRLAGIVAHTLTE